MAIFKGASTPAATRAKRVKTYRSLLFHRRLECLVRIYSSRFNVGLGDLACFRTSFLAAVVNAPLTACLRDPGPTLLSRLRAHPRSL
jgi:hypothetical protein